MHGVFVNGEHIRLERRLRPSRSGRARRGVELSRVAAAVGDVAGDGLQRHPHQPQSARAGIAGTGGQNGFSRDGRNRSTAGVRRKRRMDFHLIFPDWHEQDLRAQIRRDRNHPSVIMWSIGNEVGEQFTGANGAALAKELVRHLSMRKIRRGPRRRAMNWRAAPADPFAGGGGCHRPELSGRGHPRRAGQISGLPRKVSRTK